MSNRREVKELKMKKEFAFVALVAMIFVSMMFSSLPLVSAAYTIEYHRMTPDLTGDVNCDGKVDIKDLVRVINAFGSYLGHPKWDSQADLNEDRKVDIKDLVIVNQNFGNYESPFTPIAYSITFDFAVPNDGDDEVWYYVLTRVYVPSNLSGQGFYLFPESVNDWIRNVKMNNNLKYSGGHPACQPPANVSLGVLGQGYHLLEFEFGEQWGYGTLRFHVATASGQPAWLSRFRICVPNYSNNEYRYTVKTRTYFPGDTFFLGGYADDFIDDVYIDVGLIWQDWEWDMGLSYGAIYAWGDGFMYPLDWQYDWHNITFTFGEINSTGLLDFQYISWTHQQDRIGRPKYCAKAIPEPCSDYLIMYESAAWTGSEWDSHPGRSLRTITTTVEFFVNITEDAKWWGLESNPQRVRMAMILAWLDPLCNVGSPMDIGVYFNITCLEGSWPISPYLDASTAVALPQQDNMMRMPPSALIFNDQSERSFISPGWAVDFAGGVAGGLTAYFIAKVLGYTVFGPAGAIIGIIAGESVKQLYKFSDNEQLASVKEVEGNETYRVFQKKRLVGQTSMCEAFFVRIIPVAATNCGSVKVECAAVLWLPFPMPESPAYYCYLPIAIGFSFAFPVFITD